MLTTASCTAMNVRKVQRKTISILYFLWLQSFTLLQKHHCLIIPPFLLPSTNQNMNNQGGTNNLQHQQHDLKTTDNLDVKDVCTNPHSFLNIIYIKIHFSHTNAAIFCDEICLSYHCFIYTFFVLFCLMQHYDSCFCYNISESKPSCCSCSTFLSL